MPDKLRVDNCMYAHIETAVASLVVKIVSAFIIASYGVRVMNWELGCSPMSPLPSHTYQDPKFKQ